MKGYIGYLAGAKAETLALQAGTVLLNAGLSFLATLIVNKLVGAYQKHQQGLKDAADSAKQAATDFESAKTQMEEFAQSYRDLGDSAEWDTTSMEKAKSLQEQITLRTLTSHRIYPYNMHLRLEKQSNWIAMNISCISKPFLEMV